jgi:hypothetical protein
MEATAMEATAMEAPAMEASAMEATTTMEASATATSNQLHSGSLIRRVGRQGRRHGGHGHDWGQCSNPSNEMHDTLLSVEKPDRRARAMENDCQRIRRCRRGMAVRRCEVAAAGHNEDAATPRL